MEGFNFRPERKIGSKTYLTTAAEIKATTTTPLLAPPILVTARVEFISRDVPVDEISNGTLYSEAPKTLDFYEMLEWIKTKYPTNGRDVLEWMQYAAAVDALADRFEQDYQRNGSLFRIASGDGNIPGVSLGSDLKFRSETGNEVASNGNAVVITPYGNMKVPVPGKKTGIFKDLLIWAAVPRAWMIQFLGILMRFTQLTKNPSKTIGIPNFEGLVPPLFFEHSPDLPAPLNRVETIISTSQSQKIEFTFRNVNNYTQNLGSTTINLNQGAGTYKVYINLYGIPYVPEMVVQMQPQDQTYVCLKEWKVVFPP